MTEKFNLVPRALFPGFGGGAGPVPKAREKRPGDEVVKNFDRSKISKNALNA